MDFPVLHATNHQMAQFPSESRPTRDWLGKPGLWDLQRDPAVWSRTFEAPSSSGKAIEKHGIVMISSCIIGFIISDNTIQLVVFSVVYNIKHFFV